jgi:hypothetical protein
MKNLTIDRVLSAIRTVQGAGTGEVDRVILYVARDTAAIGIDPHRDRGCGKLQRGEPSGLWFEAIEKKKPELFYNSARIFSRFFAYCFVPPRVGATYKWSAGQSARKRIKSKQESEKMLAGLLTLRHNIKRGDIRRGAARTAAQFLSGTH